MEILSLDLMVEISREMMLGVVVGKIGLGFDESQGLLPTMAVLGVMMKHPTHGRSKCRLAGAGHGAGGDRLVMKYCRSEVMWQGDIIAAAHTRQQA